MRVLVYGASITQGFWDTQGGWVQRLRSYYDTKQIEDFSKDQPNIFNLGVSGDTTADVIKRFETETKARWQTNHRMALVFSIGTNNVAVGTDGHEFSSPDKYRQELLELVEKARHFTNKIMFVGLLPCEDEKTNPVPWAEVTYSRHRMQLFEDILRHFCSEQSIPHLPVYDKFEEELGLGTKLLQDGVHPNDRGHQLIYEMVRPELDKLLGI